MKKKKRRRAREMQCHFYGVPIYEVDEDVCERCALAKPSGWLLPTPASLLPKCPRLIGRSLARVIISG